MIYGRRAKSNRCLVLVPVLNISVYLILTVVVLKKITWRVDGIRLVDTNEAYGGC